MKLYTVKEAAKIVGVSTNTLYKYLDEDRIHAARGSALQGRFRIPQSALEEFLGISLSAPEPASSGSDPAEPLTSRPTDLLIDQPTDSMISPTSRPTDSPISPTRLPTRLARFLLVIALIAVLLDLVISNTVSLAGSIARLTFLAVMIILAYGEGGYRRSR